jgi:hypothetical protein
MDLGLVLALLSGVGIAAACGLRAFLPLLAIGIAARLGVAQLHPGAEWLADDRVLLSLGLAALLEILADKVPVVDHALDALGTVVRPAAAAVGAYAVLVHWPTPWAQALALLLGGGALALHVTRAKLRLGSTALTAGHANPLLSIAEDAGALLILAVAILAPLLVLVFLATLLWALLRLRRRRKVAAA